MYNLSIVNPVCKPIPITCGTPTQAVGLCLTTNIIQAVAPEYILCFGTRLVSRQQWGCFLAGGTSPQQTTAEHDLLIIIPTIDKRQEHEVVQMCEQQGEHLGVKVNIIAYRSEATRAALEKGSFFFQTIYQHGCILYRHTGLPLQEPPPGEILTTDATRPTWEKENARAMQFYLTARHCLDNGRTELGVFLLHQSVQHTCMALFKSIMGYRSNTHNLMRLLSLTATISPALTQLFPANTPEENALLNYLHEAYSGARYREHYTAPQIRPRYWLSEPNNSSKPLSDCTRNNPLYRKKHNPSHFP